MSIIGKIARGKKWSKLAELSDYAKENIEADPSMQKEIEFYKKSLEHTEEEPKEKALTSYKIDEIREMLKEKGIGYNENANKADLITLLEA